MLNSFCLKKYERNIPLTPISVSPMTVRKAHWEIMWEPFKKHPATTRDRLCPGQEPGGRKPVGFIKGSVSPFHRSPRLSARRPTSVSLAAPARYGHCGKRWQANWGEDALLPSFPRALLALTPRAPDNPGPHSKRLYAGRRGDREDWRPHLGTLLESSPSSLSDCCLEQL